MKKILILACAEQQNLFDEAIKKMMAEEIVLILSNIEPEKVVNPPLEIQPVIIKNTTSKKFQIKINDFSRNKFFDKPKNNFKK
jgi:malic enzyme